MGASEVFVSACACCNHQRIKNRGEVEFTSATCIGEATSYWWTPKQHGITHQVIVFPLETRGFTCCILLYTFRSPTLQATWLQGSTSVAELEKSGRKAAVPWPPWQRLMTPLATTSNSTQLPTLSQHVLTRITKTQLWGKVTPRNKVSLDLLRLWPLLSRCTIRLLNSEGIYLKYSYNENKIGTSPRTGLDRDDAPNSKASDLQTLPSSVSEPHHPAGDLGSTLERRHTRKAAKGSISSIISIPMKSHEQYNHI